MRTRPFYFLIKSYKRYTPPNMFPNFYTTLATKLLFVLVTALAKKHVHGSLRVAACVKVDLRDFSRPSCCQGK